MTLKAAASRLQDIIDEEAIQRICQFNDGGHGDTLSELIHLFLELTPKRIDHLKKSLHDQNWHAISRDAHSLKSSSANLGAKRVYSACRRLEAIENHPDLSMACALVAEIEAEYRLAAESLVGILQQRLGSRKTA
jgi:two-component system sensor histidine kinase/response regulator